MWFFTLHNPNMPILWPYAREGDAWPLLGPLKIETPRFLAKKGYFMWFFPFTPLIYAILWPRARGGRHMTIWDFLTPFEKNPNQWALLHIALAFWSKWSFHVIFIFSPPLYTHIRKHTWEAEMCEPASHCLKSNPILLSPRRTPIFQSKVVIPCDYYLYTTPIYPY
jgi:hypothetical protein